MSDNPCTALHGPRYIVQQREIKVGRDGDGPCKVGLLLFSEKTDGSSKRCLGNGNDVVEGDRACVVDSVGRPRRNFTAEPLMVEVMGAIVTLFIAVRAVSRVRMTAGRTLSS